jgi:hypothetical protein
MAAMQVDAEGSRKEPGCLRFDCLRDSENVNKFCESSNLPCWAAGGHTNGHHHCLFLPTVKIDYLACRFVRGV